MLDYSRMLGNFVKRLQVRIPVVVEDIPDSPQSIGQDPQEIPENWTLNRKESQQEMSRSDISVSERQVSKVRERFENEHWQTGSRKSQKLPADKRS